MKNYEKESFLKIFVIFFSVLALMSGAIAYLYYKEQIFSYNNGLLYQMREYNFNFKDKKFDATIVNRTSDKKVDILYITPKEVYTLFRIPTTQKKLLKILYPVEKYKKDIQSIKLRISLYYLIVLLSLLLLSVFYAFYALKPMKKAVELIEEFLKDVIHDINTPVTTILLNARFLKTKENSEELERIELSAKRILSLYKNFEVQIKGFHPEITQINPYEIINERADYFKKLYPEIDIRILGDMFVYKSDKDAFIRIIDNIISNACKYSSQNNPQIDIAVKKREITIKDNGTGIENVDKVFDRFYKENERGLGIGLNIVKKLCDELNITIDIKSEKDTGTIVKLTLN